MTRLRVKPFIAAFFRKATARCCSLMVFVLLPFVGVYPATPDELMQQANQAYINETFHEAIELYEQILEMQLESAALYYNLGNAYYQTGQAGKAILNYERARRLSPNDDAIMHNLRVIRSRITDKMEPVPQLFFINWRDQFVQLQTADGWAKTLVVLIILLTLSIALFFIMRNRVYKILTLTIGLAIILLLIVSIYAANRQYYLNHVRQEAIVMSSRATAKNAPSEGAIDLFVIHEGTKVYLTNDVMDWYEVRIPNGTVGWIRKSALEVI